MITYLDKVLSGFPVYTIGTLSNSLRLKQTISDCALVYLDLGRMYT